MCPNQLCLLDLQLPLGLHQLGHSSSAQAVSRMGLVHQDSSRTGDWKGSIPDSWALWPLSVETGMGRGENKDRWKLEKEILEKRLYEGIAELYCTVFVLQVKWVNMQLFNLILSNISYFLHLPAVAKLVCVPIAPSVVVNLTPSKNIFLVVGWNLNLLLCFLVLV